MITTQYKAAFERFFSPFAKLLVRWHVPPAAVTLAGLILSFAACAYLLVTKQVFIFCWLVLAAGLLDAVDGAVARLSGQVTKFGSYLDAICDRYVEAAVIVSVAIVTGYWVPSAIFLIGAMLVSYSKARAAMEVPVSNKEWPDLMERTERSSLYLLALVLSPALPWRLLGRDIFWWMLLVLCALTHLTVVQRMLRAKKLITARSTQHPCSN